MSTRTTPEQRQDFQRWHQRGETYTMIAAQVGVSKECVRYWCRRQRAGGNGQSPGPNRAGACLERFSPLVRYGLLRLRLEHPRWGPNRLRAGLKKRTALRGCKLPSEAGLGRYLHQWVRFRRVRKKAVARRPDQPTRVHQCWQIDFKVGIALAADRLVDLHTVRDPVGEACLGAFLFPTQAVSLRTERVPMESVRATLRACFGRWQTLPETIQTDNESTLVTTRSDGFPSLFSLWLQGLGIRHQTIRPSQPTDNAEVERCHRTVYEYALVGNEHLAVSDLQAWLDQAVFELNRELPSRAEGCAGQPPLQAHPELLQPPRPFQPEQELARFDLHRVDTYLATFTWRRKVGQNGQIGLGGRHHYYLVGRAYAHQEILVQFDPTNRHFVFFAPDRSTLEIGRRPARHLNIEDLTGLAAWPQGLGPQQLPLPFLKGLNANEQLEVKPYEYLHQA